MSTFPTLRTGATAQYPCELVLESPTRHIRFVDGRSKSFAARRIRRTWRIPLSGLREDEAAKIWEFYRQQRGSLIPFDFEDPFTGQAVPNCRFAGDSLRLALEGPQSGEAVIEVREDGEPE